MVSYWQRSVLEFLLPAAITLVLLWLLQPLARSLGLLAPQFEPPEAVALYEAADGRGWKYQSFVKF